MGQALQKIQGTSEPQVEGSGQPDPLSLWAKQHTLNDEVVIALHNNDVNSLEDLKLFNNEPQIKDYVDELGITGTMMKMKLINAIKQLTNETELKNDDDNETKTIQWEAVEGKIEKKTIHSNKFEQVKMEKINKEKKEMLSEKANVGTYFDDMSEWIKGFYEKDGAVIAAGVTVMAASLTIVPVLPAWHTASKYKDNQRINYSKQHNRMGERFNEKLSEIRKCEALIMPKLKELRQQEKKLNSHCFEMERFCDLSHKSRVVTVIGPTGFGKSLVANRLLGNEEDIDHIIKSKECPFKVAGYGDAESVTNKLNKKSKIVRLKDGDEEELYILSVVDTPGAFDSKGSDKDYNNMLSHYFGNCDGVNIFAIFFKFGDKLTNKYKELLKKYVDFFGEGLWKHCCIFITNCDMDSEKEKKKVTEGLQKTTDQINSFLEQISSKLTCNDIPMYMFGEDNFKESTSKFLWSLIDENNTFYHKYQCKNIQSPIDSLYKELKKEVTRYHQKVKELQIISRQVDEAHTNVQHWE